MENLPDKKDNIRKRKPVIAVVGAAQCDKKLADIAYQTGRCIADAGCILINGGGGGVMESSAKGASDAGGITIGVIPSENKDLCNPYIKVVIATGMGQARNAIIVASADGVVAVGGQYGTLSETAFALKYGKPVAGVFSWDNVIPEIKPFHCPEEAVNFILSAINNCI